MSESTAKEFVIPLDKNELLESRANRYSVEDIVPPDALVHVLDSTGSALQKNGPKFILQHFDTFFSVIVHGNKVHFPLTLRAFRRVLKATNSFIDDMEGIFDQGRDIAIEDKPQYLCINKMYAYLLSSLSCYIEDYIQKNSSDKDNIGKKKKNLKKSDAEEEWENDRQKALECIYKWLQLPLHKLWTPPIVEDSFITVLTQFCYKILENSKDAKQKYMRETIFEILGTLVKRYNHGITCVVRIIQLVQLYDSLGVPLAAGVVHMVSSTGCLGFIKEMVREIGQNEPGEADARNISTFLEAVASSRPDLILPILDNITEHLDNEFYAMRNCVLGVLGAVVIGALSGNDLNEEKREKRDECLKNLEEHIMDNNAYVRSKCLQIWQRLCCNRSVPLQRQSKLLKSASLRLNDKSANVRKQALQLIRALLLENPFATKIVTTDIAKDYEENLAQLKELKVAVASMSTRGDSYRLELWNTLLPEIRKAVSKTFAHDSDDNENSDDEEEDSETGSEIVPDTAFEDIRQMLLVEEVPEAVAYLKKICNMLPDTPDLSRRTRDEKENCFFAFLFKIFVESEDAIENNGETVDAGKTASAESHDSTRRKELMRLKEELKGQRMAVQFLQSCVEFAKELENAMPIVENLLHSSTTGDAVEACTLLGTAYKYGVPNSRASIQKALFQVFSRDQSVRNNVAIVYKEIYLESNEDSQSSRQKAMNSVNGLIELVKDLKPGQSPALSQLIVAWRENEELGPLEIQVLWEKFSMKIPETRPLESRAALMILTMAATAEPTLFMHGNLDVLIKIGLGERAKEDLLLARDTCRALLKIKQNSSDPEKSPLKYPNDHQMFEAIIALIKEHFTSRKNDGYISFVTDAINVTYHLADQPDVLMKDVLMSITEKVISSIETGKENSEDPSQENASQSNRSKPKNRSNAYLLSRLCYIMGHIAIRQMIYLDNGIYKELKRRNALREMKKGKASKTINPRGNPGATPLNTTGRSVATPASARQTIRNKGQANNTTHEDNGEEVLEGATADDTDAEFIIAALDGDIVNGSGILAKFVPLILDVSTHPEKYSDKQLQTWGVLALSKMMTVSSSFCVDSLQLLVTIMERSPYPEIRSNVLVGLCDLTTRFPNQVEPWTGHIYGRLRDDNLKVRHTCVRILSSLIMREMIRVKGQVSALALSIIDTDEQIRVDTKRFFKDLSNKGNALYNVMPDILSRLTDPELKLAENDFQEILKYILGLMQREKQIDTIIDKLCSRFILATTERQWRDLSYCLALLPFSGKSIRRLTESLPLLKDKIHNRLVQKSLQTIIEQTKKRVEAKAACIELEEKIKDLLSTTEEPSGQVDDREAMPPPPVPKARTKSRRQKPRRNSSSDEESEDDNIDDEDSDSENTPANGKKAANLRGRKVQNGNRLKVSNSSSDSEEEEKPETPRKAAKTPKTSTKRKKPMESRTPARATSKRNKQSESPVAGTSSEPTPRRRSARKSASNRR